MERAARSASSTPAAGSRRATPAHRRGACARGQGERAGRAAIDVGRRDRARRRRHRRHHRGGRAGRARCCNAATTPVIVVVNKVDDERREPEIWQFARARPRRPVRRSRRCTAGCRASCSTRSSPRCPTRAGRRRGRRRNDPTTASSRSRSSAARTSASRRCSTGSSATSARSCTTCPARRATRSTRSSRPTTGRCASSTPPGCAARAASTSRPSTTASCARSQAIDRADAALLVIDATEGVTHQDQRLAERVDAAGTAIVLVLNKWDLLDAEERAKVRAPGRGQARRSSPTRRCSRSPR